MARASWLRVTRQQQNWRPSDEYRNIRIDSTACLRAARAGLPGRSWLRRLELVDDHVLDARHVLDGLDGLDGFDRVGIVRLDHDELRLVRLDHDELGLVVNPAEQRRRQRQ